MEAHDRWGLHGEHGAHMLCMAASTLGTKDRGAPQLAVVASIAVGVLSDVVHR